jgi:hypothetical protein
MLNWQSDEAEANPMDQVGKIRECTLWMMLGFCALAVMPDLQAQMCPMEPSLDYIVASADRVAIAHIEKIGEVTSDGKAAVWPVTLAITERMSGDSVEEATVTFPKRGESMAPSGVPLDTLRVWQAQHDRLLVMMSRYSEKWHVIAVFNLDHGIPDVVSSEMRPLKTWTDVLRVARAEAQWINSPAGVEYQSEKETRTPASPRWNAFDNGRLDSYITGCSNPEPALEGTRFVHESIIIPADERLEREAHAELDGTGPSRAVGVSKLRSFKSEDNITLLRGLLRDPDINLRKEAWIVLNGWGVKDIPAWSEMP